MSNSRRERELLIRLAPIYLACRWRVMGGALRGIWPKSDISFDMLGCCDYAAEMRLLVSEWRNSFSVGK